MTYFHPSNPAWKAAGRAARPLIKLAFWRSSVSGEGSGLFGKAGQSDTVTDPADQSGAESRQERKLVELLSPLALWAVQCRTVKIMMWHFGLREVPKSHMSEVQAATVSLCFFICPVHPQCCFFSLFSLEFATLQQSRDNTQILREVGGEEGGQSGYCTSVLPLSCATGRVLCCLQGQQQAKRDILIATGPQRTHPHGDKEWRRARH